MRIAEITRGDDPDEVVTRTIFKRNARTDEFERVGESIALKNVAELRGWTDDELETELANRRRVLAYLVDNEVTDYRAVAATLHMYARDPEHIIDLIETDGLDPSEFLWED